MDYPPLEIKVWGELACFTRPEAKVERVSYEVLTPSAARNILQAIYWHPQMQWQIREIWVLNPIRWISITTNELEGRATLSYARKRIVGQAVPYTAQYERQQRHNLVLRDVAYLVRADIASEDEPAKHRAQFRRRVSSGACHSRPYFGIREFACHFGDPDGVEHPIDITRNLGRMLFDLHYSGDGRGLPIWFNARLEHGVLHVPKYLYAQRRTA